MSLVSVLLNEEEAFVLYNAVDFYYNEHSIYPESEELIIREFLSKIKTFLDKEGARTNGH